MIHTYLLKKNPFLFFLILQVLVVLFVIGLFGFAKTDQPVLSIRLAAFFAGSTFLALGIFMTWKLMKMTHFTRTISFYATIIYIALACLPLLLARIFQWGIPVGAITILGINGSQWHYLSETIFKMLLVTTVIDAILWWKFSHAKLNQQK